MILLSADVNANVGNSLGDWLAAVLRTCYQRRFRDKLVDRTMLDQLGKAGIATGWSISPIFTGRYYDPATKTLYLERSFHVEILDAPYPLLLAIAEALRLILRQEEVILKSYDTGVAEHIRAR
jgi:hypothetical protein